jgi:TPR repeat protein
VPAVDATRFLNRGRQALQQGDVAAARLFFERAADAEIATAALELALTYDPDVIADPGARLGTVTADRAQARAWYQRAEKLGVTGLGPRLQALAR